MVGNMLSRPMIGRHPGRAHGRLGCAHPDHTGGPQGLDLTVTPTRHRQRQTNVGPNRDEYWFSSTPNLPTKTIPAKICWLTNSRRFPMDMKMSPLESKILL